MKKHTSIPTILGENFRKAREAQGISVADLASKAILSKNHIEQIENGGNQSFYTEAIKVQSAKKVAKILGLVDEEAFFVKQTKHSQRPPLQFPEIEKTEPVEALETELEVNAKISSAPKVESKQALEVKKVLSANLKKASSIGTHFEEVIATTRADINNDPRQTISYPKFFAYLGGAAALVLLITQYNYQSKGVKINPIVALVPYLDRQEQNQAEAYRDIEPVQKSKAPPIETTDAKEASKVSSKIAATILECSGLLADPEKYMPAMASKIGNQVYVLGNTEATICFEDADGNQQKKRFNSKRWS